MERYGPIYTVYILFYHMTFRWQCQWQRQWLLPSATSGTSHIATIPGKTLTQDIILADKPFKTHPPTQAINHPRPTRRMHSERRDIGAAQQQHQPHNRSHRLSPRNGIQTQTDQRAAEDKIQE